MRLEPYVLTSNYSDRVILACEVRFAPLMSCPLAHQHLLFPADRFNDLAWQILLWFSFFHLGKCNRWWDQCAYKILDCHWRFEFGLFDHICSSTYFIFHVTSRSWWPYLLLSVFDSSCSFWTTHWKFQPTGRFLSIHLFENYLIPAAAIRMWSKTLQRWIVVKSCMCALLHCFMMYWHQLVFLSSTSPLHLFDSRSFIAFKGGSTSSTKPSFMHSKICNNDNTNHVFEPRIY